MDARFEISTQKLVSTHGEKKTALNRSELLQTQAIFLNFPIFVIFVIFATSEGLSRNPGQIVKF
jgi:hypothetical protein